MHRIGRGGCDQHVKVPGKGSFLPGFLYGSRVATEVSTAGNHAGIHWIAPKGMVDGTGLRREFFDAINMVAAVATSFD